MSVQSTSPRSNKRSRECDEHEDANTFRNELLQQSNEPPTFYQWQEESRTIREASLARSSTGSLTDPRSVTPSVRSVSREKTPASSSIQIVINVTGEEGKGVGPPPTKKAKLTFAEKEAEREMKKVERERREQEKSLKDIEKAARDAERDASRKVKEAEKAAKDAEKAVRDAEREDKKKKRLEEKQKKDEERQKKDEEKQKLEEEKKKKERSQKTLASFFNVPTTLKPDKRTSTSPAPNQGVQVDTAVSPRKEVSPRKDASPAKSTLSAYEKMFPPFFVQNGVTLAPYNKFERDEDGLAVVTTILDSYLLNNRSPGKRRSLEPSTLFHLSKHGPTRRGRQITSVREIMDETSMPGNMNQPIDLTSESHGQKKLSVMENLQKVPLKTLRFQEDVRPPYRGTYTAKPLCGEQRLARNFLRKELPGVNYDYDSEAEWVEDEDAEDLDSEDGEDEGEDGDEDMEEFLDDEADEGFVRRSHPLQADLSPICTGLYWEGKETNQEIAKGLQKHRLEFILDPTIKTIDPFSTAYWAPAVPAAKAKSMNSISSMASQNSTAMNPPRLPLNNLKAANLGVNGTKSILSVLKPPPDGMAHGAGKAKTAGAEKKLIPAEDMEAFKAAVQGSDLSKIGLIEVLKKRFPGRNAAAIKGTLETVAKRLGGKEVDKRWVLLEETN